jgi:hypothetical protein
MIISEILPNPIGQDSLGEFVQLYNNGSEPVNLNGYYLENSAGKKFFLSGWIGKSEYLVFKKPNLKINIKNQDEKISLYNNNGQLVDSLKFYGSAPEGKILIHSQAGIGEFFDLNAAKNLSASVYQNFSNQTVFRQELGGFDLLLMIIGVSFLLSILSLIIISSYEK